MAERSPYLKDWRLADVIAALTVMGRYPYSSRLAFWLAGNGFGGGVTSGPAVMGG